MEYPYIPASGPWRYPTATAYEAELLETKRNSSLLLFRDFQSGGFDTPLFVAKQLYNTQEMVFYV